MNYGQTQYLIPTMRPKSRWPKVVMFIVCMAAVVAAWWLTK